MSAYDQTLRADPGPDAGWPVEAAQNGVSVVAPPTGLLVQSAREIASLPEPPRAAELCGPILTRGCRTVLGAATGHGKTRFTVQAARSAVEGHDFIGFQGVGGCRALVIDAEQNLRTIRRRIAEVGLGDSDAVDFLRVPDGLALEQEGPEVEEFERLLEQGAYGLVCADPLYKLHRGDSNDERQAVDLCRRLDGWRERFDFALLLNVHPRKRPPQGAKFSMDDFFGSGAFTRGAEVVLGLERLRPGFSRLHFFKDRDGDLPVGESWGLLFDAEAGFRRNPEAEASKPSTVGEVRALLEADPGLTGDALRSATGRSERTIRSALSNLGAVSEGKPKRWSLPVQEGLDV